MVEEVKRAAVILDPDNWLTPVLGTPNQHRALVKKLQGLGYKSIRDALNDWPLYRDDPRGLFTDPDKINKHQAHLLFDELRSDHFFYRSKGGRRAP